MFEIEQMEQQFDYSLVDNDTADFLRSCEYEINGIAEDARVKFGAVLKKAQDKLANHHEGVFRKWFESGGLDKNNVYYYIGIYQSSRNLDNDQRDNFLKAPKTVQKKVMKKNTPDEVKEAVLSGEVKTNKELEKMQREIEEKNELISKREKENDILQSKLEEMENHEPEVIERFTDPEDYQTIKDYNEHLEGVVKTQESQFNELKEEMKNVRPKTKDDSNDEVLDSLYMSICGIEGLFLSKSKKIKGRDLSYLISATENLLETIKEINGGIEND